MTQRYQWAVRGWYTSYWKRPSIEEELKHRAGEEILKLIPRQQPTVVEWSIDCALIGLDQEEWRLTLLLTPTETRDVVFYKPPKVDYTYYQPAFPEVESDDYLDRIPHSVL